MPTRKAKAVAAPVVRPVTWQLALEAESVGGDVLPMRPVAWVDVAKHPQVAAIHGIKAGQQLRVVMKLPAGPLTYDQDAVLLDAGDGRPPIVLWAHQILRSLRCGREGCNDDLKDPDETLCPRCRFDARYLK